MSNSPAANPGGKFLALTRERGLKIALAQAFAAFSLLLLPFGRADGGRSFCTVHELH
jgi:hypothetical protein